MKKQIFALFLLLLLLVPMFWGIFQLRRIRRHLRDAKLDPESRWIVEIDDENISVTDDNGKRTSLAKAELTGVAVETNDSGPVGIDFWWLLYEADGGIACAVPQGATGEPALVEYLQALPGFDNTAFTKAIRSTDDDVFALWTRPT
jgi:hypothetical protein